MQLNQMPPNPANDKNILEKYTVNLNKQAELDKLDPVIGRQDEINRVIRILSRKTKNNPVLIGEPGVGKTAIVEGLAQRIVKQDVPINLKDKYIYQLDMGSLVAGAKFHGEFEERLKAVLNRIKKDNNVILFIDELHLIVGAGRTQGSMDASNLLKPLLAKGELRCIGATTLDEHRQYINNDAALERRFQKIIVKEPTLEDTISILRGLKERFETFHGVIIHDSAIVSAAKLSQRYIPNRFLPDKAIDLIDEASANIKTQIGSVPIDLDNLNHKIMQLEIEKAALKKEKDTISCERLSNIINELKVSKIQQQKLSEIWSKEKKAIQIFNNIKEQIEQYKIELTKLPYNGDFNRAGEIQYSLLPKLKKELQEAQKQIKDNKWTHEDVTSKEIAEITEKWTGIKVQKLLETEKDKLINLKNILSERVKGQSKAIQVLSDAILRSRSGIKDPEHPIGSFLFLGSTGVGKTELARSLAYVLFDSKKNITRLDMSEYIEKHSISKLIGSPPGYIGYEKGGTLTEAIHNKPYSIVLFDEIEKAHSEVINILLQILDAGVLTDSLGKTVDFKNTIIIMTSNVGSEYLISEFNENTDKLIQKELTKIFKPELMNRIDNVVVFNSLGKSTIKEIIKKELKELSDRILREKNIGISFENSVVDLILKEAYSKEFGARPITRFIQQNIEIVIANYLIQNKIKVNYNYILQYDEKQKFHLKSSLKYI